MKKQLIWADQKQMVWIPAGECAIGSDYGCSDEQPVHPFQTKGFYMDATPVTNKEFRAFCDATGRGYPAQPPWPQMPDYFLRYPDHPVVNVPHGVCKAYAAWAGKRLPTEEEWEYAARGGKQTTYPWGEEHPYEGGVARANFADRNSYQPWRDGLCDDGYGYTAPVGSFAPNPYGLYDMAGNVYQYVEDWYFTYSDTVKSTERFNDGWGGNRVCRGGSFHSPAADLRVARRHHIMGGGPNEAVGFRCVSDSGEIPASACAVKPPEERSAPKPDRFYEVTPHPVQAGEGTQLCAGGGPPLSETVLAKLKHLGFTSVEEYVTWRSCENGGKGKWDFSKWDEEVRKLKQAGLKWLPFMILGPGYSLPDWFLYSPEHRGLCCAEHGIESQVQSIWDPKVKHYVDRFFKAFAAHFTDTDIFEGLLFGISGDFGEAIYSVWHGNWPTHTCGTYHAHAGYWCADPFAKADFKKKMERKYKTVDRLNAAWQTDFTSFATLTFPKMQVDMDRSNIDRYTDEGILLVEKPADRVRILDFVDWYRGCMTDYVTFWMQTAKKYFPNTRLLLCTGGEAQPCHGSEFAAQSKACAKVGGGVRITNEDSQFEKNFCITNWVGSACAYYGAEFSFEPAGGVTERGVVCRIYNASAIGADGLHYYIGNVIDGGGRQQNFARDIHHFTRLPVKRELALFYPDTAIMFRPEARGEMIASFSAMRDFEDYAFVDDLTIQDGILSTVKAVVLTVGGHYRTATLKKLMNFVKNGGLLVGAGVQDLWGIEDGINYRDLLFAWQGEKTLGKGKTLWLDHNLYDSRDDAEVTDLLFAPMEAFFTQNGMEIADSKRDRFYVSHKGDGYLLMNYGTQPITRNIHTKQGEINITLDPATIQFVKG